MCIVQPYVTEMDLRHSLIPDDLIEDLLHSMPKHTGPDLEVDRQVPKYDYIGFMEKMAGGGDISPNEGDNKAASRSPAKSNMKLNGAAAIQSSPRKENLRSMDMIRPGAGA